MRNEQNAETLLNEDNEKIKVLFYQQIRHLTIETPRVIKEVTIKEQLYPSIFDFLGIGNAQIK